MVQEEKKRNKKESNQFEVFLCTIFMITCNFEKFVIKTGKSYFYAFYCIIVMVHYNMLKKFLIKLNVLLRNF